MKDRWTCPSCATDIEDDFDICWQCGTDQRGNTDPYFMPEPKEQPQNPDHPAAKNTDDASVDTRFDVVKTDTRIQITIPMPLPYHPVPRSMENLDLLVIIVLPIWMICDAIYRAIKKPTPPPRAVLTVTERRFMLELTNPKNGEQMTHRFDVTKIHELRKNRVDHGLWVHVRGESMEHFLEDIDDDTIHAICRELNSVIAKNRGEEAGSAEPA
jgi:hypothetical protein